MIAMTLHLKPCSSCTSFFIYSLVLFAHYALAIVDDPWIVCSGKCLMQFQATDKSF